ncbi:MAG: CAP domain-containing protein [Acidobacteria bacterium]|nr:CAP domain-containing protein [Acidobacteriota bacterium]
MKKLPIAFILLLTLTASSGPGLSKAPVSPETAVLGPLYIQVPDISECIPGKLTDKEIQTAFKVVNRIRALHRLSPVTYKNSIDEASAKAALIVAANRSMTHHPSRESLCFSDEGAEASSHSNLFISTYSIWDPTLSGRRVPDIVTQMKKYLIPTSDIVAGWLIDHNVPSLGHRRWLLNPFLTEISFGRVDTIRHSGSRWDVITGGALVYRAVKGMPSLPANFFVACPFNDYPASFFDKNEFLSFSAIPISANIFGNELVQLDAARITITDQYGKSMPVRDIHWDNNAYGVPNALIWKTPGLKLNKRYHVTISNVRFGNSAHTYRYWFRVIP